MKKLLALLLALAMVLPLAVACTEEPAPPAPEPPAEPAIEELQIFTDGVCYLYYDRSSIRDIKPLANAISEATGVEVEAVAVYEKSSGSSLLEIEDNAILVGNVILPDGSRSAGALRSADHMVGILDDRFVIGGLTNAATEKAVEHFLSAVLPEIDDAGNLTFHKDSNYRINGKYSLADVSINGVSIGHFKIHVSPDCTVSEWRTAVLLKQFLTDRLGYAPELVKADTCTGRGVIRIGNDVCETTVSGAHDYAININGTTVEVVAESVFGYLEAQQQLFEVMLYNVDKSEVHDLDNAAGKQGNGLGQAKEPLEINGDLRVMFHNIHGQIEGGDMPVEQPTEMMAELYLEYLPDVIGLQECTSHTFRAGIVELLSSEYDMVWDEQTCTAMFYRRSTVELLDSGYFCFNDIEDEFTEGHIYHDLIEEKGFTVNDIYNNNINKDGNQGKRYDSSKGVTWGIFRLKYTGNIFMAGSTHLWWENNADSALDEATRMVQMRSLRNQVTKAADAYAAANGIEKGSIPILVGGDYNSSYERHTSLKTMTSNVNAEPFVNVNSLSTSPLTVSTHHTYSRYDKELEIYVDIVKNGNSYQRAIDHIFMNASAQDTITPNYTGIIDDDYSYLSSDHIPIYTDITFNASAPKTN